MSDRRLHQYFGPSPRFDRGCVELSFPVDGLARSPASFDALLVHYGFKLGVDLPDSPGPLDETVCQLTAAMLTSASLGLSEPWWNRHGQANGVGWAAIAHPLPQTAAMALDCALDLARAGTPLPQTVADKLQRLSRRLAKTKKTRVLILAAAERYGLATAQVNAETTIYQLGQGTKGLHFDQACNQLDAATGMLIAQDKYATALTLARVGLPATRGVLVRDERQVGDAIARVGLPCVVKPISLNQGRGVMTGLQTEAQVRAAVAHARTLAPQPVLIENHVEGDDHRLVVSRGAFLWVYRKRPTRIRGDGEASIGQLIDRENARRKAIRRGTDAYIYPIARDEQLDMFLADRHGMDAATVLPAGTVIEVSSQANAARGGIIDDVTAAVHPDNRAMAIRVARLVRLSAVGIDFVIPDIARSWKEVPGAIVEVNHAPAVSGMGDTGLLIRSIFPNRLSGRIPTVVAVGDQAFRDEAAATVRAAFTERGLRLASAEYLETMFPDGPKIGLLAAAPPIEALLLDPEADAALVTGELAAVQRWGAPLRRCDLLVTQDAPDAWLTATAELVLHGGAALAEIGRAIDTLVERYADPLEGGALPVLEPAGDDGTGEFRLTVWRAQAVPRAAFWQQVGLDTPNADGLTGPEDLLAAVRALAAHALGTKAGLAEAFTHGELIGSWFRMTFEAAIALPPGQAAQARAALLAATARVNAIATAPPEPGR